MGDHTSGQRLPAERTLLLLTFHLGSARFGLKALDVREIVRAVAVAPLPKAPAIVEGVINVRGTIVPVLDIRARFGLAPKPLHSDQHFIIAHTAARLVALRVDRATEMLSLLPDAIEPPGRSAPGVEYVAGIARLADGLVVIHDIDAFLSHDEGWAMDAAMADTA